MGGSGALRPRGRRGGISERQYEITEVGQAYLEFWANSLTQYREEMDLFFSTYAGAPAKGVRG